MLDGEFFAARWVPRLDVWRVWQWQGGEPVPVADTVYVGPAARSRATAAATRLNLARDVVTREALAAWAEVPGLPDEALDLLRKAG